MAPGLDPSLDALPERDADLDPHPVDLGPWRLVAVLGRGATSMVYAARHAESGRGRALKVQRVPGPQVAARIRREGQLQGRLRHPGLLPVHATFEHAGRVVLEMEQVDGCTLEAWVAARHPLPLSQVAALLLPVLEGLDAAHRLGIVHRDLKPANVLVEGEGARALLGDFGIARVLGEAEDPLETRVGLPMGTPGYMPPEQWADASTAGVRADVFTAGALVWFTLTGRPPFSGADPTALLRATLEGRCEDLAAARPDCPAALVAAVTACLCASPEQRPASLGPLCRALAPGRSAIEDPDTVLPLRPVAPEAAAPPARPPGAARRPRTALPGWAGAALAGLLLGLLGWAGLRALGLLAAPAESPPSPVDPPPADAPLAETPASPPPQEAPAAPSASAAPSPPVPGCVASEGELIGWWWAGTELRRSLWGGVRVQQETNVRAAPPDGVEGAPAPVRCVLPAGSRVDVRAAPLEIGGQLWVPLYGGDLRRR